MWHAFIKGTIRGYIHAERKAASIRHTDEGYILAPDHRPGRHKKQLKKRKQLCDKLCICTPTHPNSPLISAPACSTHMPCHMRRAWPGCAPLKQKMAVAQCPAVRAGTIVVITNPRIHDLRVVSLTQHPLRALRVAARRLRPLNRREARTASSLRYWSLVHQRRPQPLFWQLQDALPSGPDK